MTCAVFVPPAAHAVDEIEAQLTGWPNLLQLTAATFLVPSCMCAYLLRPVGAAVYGGNAVCSVYAHRPNRTNADTASDTVDLCMVGIWVGYNLVVVLQGGILHQYLIGAVSMALLVLATKVWSRQLVYRSRERYAVHAAMHLCGVAGSILLHVNHANKPHTHSVVL